MDQDLDLSIAARTDDCPHMSVIKQARRKMIDVGGTPATVVLCRESGLEMPACHKSPIGDRGVPLSRAGTPSCSWEAVKKCFRRNAQGRRDADPVIYRSHGGGC